MISRRSLRAVVFDLDEAILRAESAIIASWRARYIQRKLRFLEEPCAARIDARAPRWDPYATLVARHGLEPLFPCVVAREDVRDIKPAPSRFVQAVALLGMSAGAAPEARARKARSPSSSFAAELTSAGARSA
jgi:beta-phosphoglucomutase-like phosphatase (HAD superfamily)